MTPFLTGSYITCEEYRAAPTALATNNLVTTTVNPTQADQDAELAGIIGRASRWIDNVARQPLYATQTVNQAEKARVDSDGYVILKARQDRVKSVDAFSWGATFQSMTTMTPPIPTGQYIVEENRIRLSLTNSGVIWTGSLGFLAIPRWGDVMVQWSYTAGWTSTRLASNASQGATSIQVEAATGILPGMTARITTGQLQVNVQVALTYTPGSTTVPLTAPLAAAWGQGAWFGEAPDDIKEASILATSHYIKERKGGGLALAGKGNIVAEKQEIGLELIQAEEIAARYERRSP